MAFFASILSDLRHAVRTLLSGRLFSLVAVVCLALGIATNTAMFSVFDAMFLRPLPFADADRLVSIAGRQPQTGRRVSLSLDDARQLAATVGSIEELAAYSGRTVTLADGGEPERVAVQLVTWNLPSMLGVTPERGRAFATTDDRIAAADVALISDGLWRRRYQADPSVVGRAIHLDDRSYTVTGVMPSTFRFPGTNEIWIPMTPALGAAAVLSRGVSVVGRLSSGATIERSNAELALRSLPARGSTGPRTGLARALRTVSVGSEERTITGALMGATTVLLLIACANVANLLLARGARRRREIALRAALGASRRRIVRQLLTEAVVLSSVAGVVALPLAWAGIGWVRDAVPPSDPMVPPYMAWSLDLRTFAYAVAIALVTGLAFGMAPAVDAAGRRLLNPLREGAHSGGGRVQRRAHTTLIVAQLALALTLLAGASLFVRTYAGLSRVELGYDPARLMTMRVYLAGQAYDAEADRSRAIDAIAARLTSLAGAEAATVSDLVPLDDQGGSDAPVDVEGRAFGPDRQPTVQYAGVAGRWLETLDLRLVAGRTFTDRELASDAPVALVNRRLVDDFWPGENPIGRRFRFADDPAAPWFSVIGVVPDIRTVKLDESAGTPPTAWLPHRFVSTRNYGIIARTRGASASVTAGVREAVHAVDPSLALFDVWSMEEVRWLSYWMYVMWGAMFAVFGAIALFVAAVGVYGVVYYTVEQRTREIGLRVALGATRRQVVGPMLRQTGWLAATGVAVGLAGALLVTPAVGSLLIGVAPDDPASLAAVSVALGTMAIVATWIPAWRASAVDPVIALRQE
jgi:putative ABC transport system permease protein